MTPPIVKQLPGEASGTLKGKEAVRAYWSKALQLHRELHFTLLGV